ncbi:TIGR03089 family protein [Actinomadura rudentiformis]|uniref:TIGR03089 family protein n=1 Tax=Actinomadura rudentiformis TaxID=359158 RepID=A0A6H9ZB40_9ACTN|nr:TIGR03089 family protein [Actinomadura rudentiformis]KAB2351542.1 TIGR03089 family protein [Actinomadura rudentiformis]
MPDLEPDLESGPGHDAGPADLLRRRVAADPSRPFVTFYDDKTGERVELSARTFDNWVAKTANLLVDGLAAEAGGRAVLVLPPHWQSAVWLMACWSAGLHVEVVDPESAGFGERVRSGEPVGGTGPYLLAAAEEVLGDVIDDQEADEVIGLSLHALGGPLTEVPGGVIDYAVEVRAYGDRFVPGPEVTPQLPAASLMQGSTVTKTTFTGAELVRAAHDAAVKWGLDAQDRVLVDMSYATLDGVLTGLLAPLASGASVIIQRNFHKDALDHRVSLEHVTVVAGVSGWNDESGSVRRLA